jgi:endoglucanase
VVTPATKFYVDPHSKAAKQALVDLGNGDIENATNMARLASWPQAQWFTEGTPDAVRVQVNRLVQRARAVDRTPVLVAYNPRAGTARSTPAAGPRPPPRTGSGSTPSPPA